MVLKEVGELVVEKDSVLQFCGDVEFDDTLLFGRDVSDRCIGGVVEESVSGGGWFGIAIRRAQPIRKLV
jgi:hypothetical protein